ncbi:DUF2686 family protein [Escherichia coli]|nr:DUF2686 family protein [Escherichia coli]
MTLPTTIYSFPAYLSRFSSTDKPVKLKFHQYARATLLSNRGRDHNCDGRRTVEIHKLDLSDWQAFNKLATKCNAYDGVTMNGDNSFGWNHEATLDNIHAQKYNKAYAGARLTAELKYLLQDVESFEPNSKYTIHEVVLGLGYGTPDYTGQTIGYVVTLPAQMPNCWSSELPTIDLYIDQLRTVTGVSNALGFIIAALLNAYSDLPHDLKIGLRSLSSSAAIYSGLGFERVPQERDISCARMYLTPANHPDLWTQENGEWIYLRN